MGEVGESTSVQDSIEQKFTQNEQKVKEGLKHVDELTEIQYIPGLENRVGLFPKLESLPDRPVLARFSYGKDAGNMSAVFFDSARGESEVTNDRNRRDFFKSQGFSENIIQIKGKFEGTEAQIEEVSLETLEDKKFIIGNLIFTRDPRIAMYILPADCSTVVIYAKDKDGNDLVAIDHCGADAVNAGITRQGLWYLQDELGVDLSQATAVVFPGVSQENFYITNEPERRGNGIVERNWGPFITPKQTDDPSERRYVDILSAFEMQALQAGIKPENIQAYRRDTYKDAAQGIAYSRRYSDEHNREHDGGNLVAIQLATK
ncbi:MAG: laccase domain-containing protein [Candidatus Levyibacteriota bacterium]|jgi:copper oxidase (laccase) domain-containing protein